MRGCFSTTSNANTTFTALAFTTRLVSIIWTGVEARLMSANAAQGLFVEQRRVEPGSSSTFNAEGLRFVELGAGFFSSDDVVGLLAHRARDFAAGGFDHLLGGVASESGQGTGQHEGEAFEGGGGDVIFAGHGKAELFEAIDEGAVAIVLEELVDGGGDFLGADVVDGGEGGNVGGSR